MNKSDVTWAIKLSIRMIFSSILIELALHTTVIYFLDVYNKHLYSYFSLEAQIMGAILRPFLLRSKYIVYYGFSNLVNKLVGMRVFELPNCPATFHTISELWR